MQLTYTLENIENTALQVFDFLQKNSNKKIIAFYGQMGSGKTTVIKQLCKNLNVINNVVSPTFAIINEYETTSGQKIFHFDFYRLKDLQEALDIGTEDYFYTKNYCFIEWPEIIEPILPENHIKIQIEILSDFERKLTIIN